jgi:2-polyprenyl-3-methyl-5-hydroxy-6-metoxy-1,4-benzoquinol methylase
MAGITDHVQDNSSSSRKAHWEQIYAVRRPSETSWYQLHPEFSLAMIEHTGLGTGARLIDVGGGASTLVDHLLAAGYRNVTVLDIAGTAIEQAKARLGKQAGLITWLETDINDYVPAQPFDIWHDRAVFHFLTSETLRTRYVRTLNMALKPGSYAIIATFAEHGPSKCSGLDVVRYSPESLSRALGHTLRLVETQREEHHTPNGGIQQFNYCRFIRTENQ